MVYADIAMSREPTIGDVLRDLLRAKAYIFVGALLGFICALAWLAVAVPHYRAEMLVGPAERSGGRDIKALLPDNSSFAVQYLVNTLGSPDSIDFIRFEQIVREPTVAAQLIKDPLIAAGISADRLTRLSLGRPAPGTPEKLSAYLMDKVAVEPVGTSPLRRLVYNHPDPAFATYLLQKMQSAADRLIRDEVRKTAASRAAYLEKELAGVANPEHRRALTSLLMEQEHLEMILAMDEPFAATVAEPAFAGARPAWPRTRIILPFGLLIGAFLGYALFTVKK
jgi:uncharacterized protein involved in exopolysaccharide biosynthesis